MNSRDSKIDVYKSLPSAELNKRDAIRVEQLTIPAMSDGLILNQELFSVERRCKRDTEHSIRGILTDVAGLPQFTVLGQVQDIFIPQNVKTVSQLVYQMNAFFRRLMVKLVTTTEIFEDGVNHFNIPEDFEYQADADWYTVQETNRGQRVSTAIEAIYRSDGRVGFKFTPDGQILFVLRLSDEGQRIFGWKHRYIALDENNKFTK